jgi:hypothetical protein
MKASSLIAPILLTLLLGGGSCQQFAKDDETLLAKYGGTYVPTGEGPLAYTTPVDAVIFDSEKRALTDDDLKKVFPAVQHMDPYRLHLGGRHTIGDPSIDLINWLQSLRVLDVSGTNVTLEGLKRVRVKDLRQVYVARDKFTDADVQALQDAIKPATVSRLSP